MIPSIDFFITALVLVGNLSIGTITFLNNRKSATNRLLLCFTLTLALYSVLNFLSLNQNSDGQTFFWVKWVMSVVPFLNFLYFLLVHTFPNTKITMQKRYLLLYFLFTLAVLPLSLSNLVFTDVVSSGGNYISVPGPGMAIFLIHTLFFLGGGFLVLIKKYRKSQGKERRQLKFFVAATVLMYSLIITTNLLLVLVFNITILINLLPLYIFIFIALVSYAIFQLGLFDVRVLATEASTLVLWIILFAKFVTAREPGEAVVDLFVLVMATIFGVLLVRSVKKEVSQRRELETLNEKLQELDEKKDEFVNVAAHELRAPMTAIKGYLSMILEGDAGEVPQEMRNYLNEVVTGNERLIRLVNNMLNVSRIEEGRMVYSIGDVEINGVVKTVVHEYQEQAEQKGLKLHFETSEQAQYIVTVDPDRIYEVVSNLISNAVKYTDTGTVTVKVHLLSTNAVRVDILDTGPGMSPEEQQKLFQKFYRAESNVGKQIGTGLGLYISKLLIEKFGGKIGVISEKGKGSNFWFELPLKK